ncbi:hypothetical protein, partial [Rhizobium sp. NPDC090279]|uniref:hypothetical protein n=1 Tax=Rhizobium sp. NPDC090279 TaxID=3364499 RepID=UPI00383B4859
MEKLSDPMNAMNAAMFDRRRQALLQRRLSGKAGGGAPSILPMDRSGPLALSFGQQRLWFLDRLEP